MSKMGDLIVSVIKIIRTVFEGGFVARACVYKFCGFSIYRQTESVDTVALSAQIDGDDIIKSN